MAPPDEAFQKGVAAEAAPDKFSLGSNATRRAIHNGFVALGATLVAVGSALAAYRLLHGLQMYSQFVVGTLAWGADSKAGELVAALVFMLALPVALCSLGRASALYSRSNPTDALVALQFACAPGAVWMAHTLF